MRTKAVKNRIQSNKVKRYKRRIFGVNWRTQEAHGVLLQRLPQDRPWKPFDRHGLPTFHYVSTLPHDWERRIGPGRHFKNPLAPYVMTVEQMRLQIKRARGLIP